MKRKTRKATHSVAGQILGYLVEHQNARDTLEGIAGWWIPQHRLKCELEQAKAALEELVGEGYLVAQELADGRVHYRLNLGREHDIREFLGQDAAAGGTKPGDLPLDLLPGLERNLSRWRRPPE